LREVDFESTNSRIIIIKKLIGEIFFLFGCAHKLFELGHIIFYKRPKTPGDTIGMFFADYNGEYMQKVKYV